MAVSNLITRPGAPGNAPAGHDPALPAHPRDSEPLDHRRPGITQRLPCPARRPPARRPGPATPRKARSGTRNPARQPATTGKASSPGGDDDRGGQLIAAAAGIIAEAGNDGRRLSQTALAEKLRSQGYSIANDRLRWLASVCGLESRNG